MGKKINAKEDVAKKIMDYIALHQTGELSLDVIAKELNYSKFYMGRAFAQTTGMTVHKYIKERRLEAAAGQLEGTGRPVIEIALDAGYGSHQAFTQAFHRRYQCSPQDYRKKTGCRKELVSGKKWALQKNPFFREERGLQKNQVSPEKWVSGKKYVSKKDLLWRKNKGSMCRPMAYGYQKGRMAA